MKRWIPNFNLDVSKRIIGHVDLLEGTLIRGWALSKSSPELPVYVRCRLNGKETKPELAIGGRPDIAAAGLGTSFCGFEIDITDLLAHAEARGGKKLRVDVLAGYDEFSKIGYWELAPSNVVFQRDEYVSAEDVVGYVDGLENGFISGWALGKNSPEIPVLVQCRLNGDLTKPVPALIDRPDVAKTGVGTSICGFKIDVSGLVRSAASHNDERLKIEILAGYRNLRAFGGVAIEPWQIDFRVLGVSPVKVKKMRAVCAHLLMSANMDLQERVRELPYLQDLVDNGLKSKATLGDPLSKLFVQTGIPETVRSSQGSAILISNYSDQQRYRFNANRGLRVDLAQEDSFLRWYLECYGSIRNWRRAPLSADEIEYLSDGGEFEPTKVMKFFMPPELRSAVPSSIAYWWATKEAPRLFVEDCLVPDWCIESLKAASSTFQNRVFPLCSFAEIFFSENPDLHFLHLDNDGDRLLYYIYLVFRAALRPDFLRYLPDQVIKLFFPNHGMATQDNFTANILRLYKIIQMDENFLPPHLLYKNIVGRLFDVKTMSFATVSSEGHRLLGARLPLPKPSEKDDILIIGPFEKASGLGQACRLSADMLKRTGLSVNTFNFGIDNPAPEGYSSRYGSTRSLSKASINVIHLNAESAQLAFAYMPEVFSNSYNIGYFYWELDTPAACHHLSIELLDEIWVSSEYCREIYASATTKPVVNVGMCVEDIKKIDKAEALEYLRHKLSFSGGEFVFLAAFDSFSFVQRKNPLGVIRAFKEAFPVEQEVRLIIKTHNKALVQDSNQLRIWEAVDKELKEDKRICLFDETLSYADLRKLKSSVDCYVSLHRSEGWGFGIIEAMASGVPVIATAYSGNMDFCNPENSWLVDYDLTYLYPDDYIFVKPGQRWAEPQIASAVAQMRSVAFDQAERTRRANAASELIQREFSEQAVSVRYEKRIKEILLEASSLRKNG